MNRLKHIFIPSSQGEAFEAIELIGTGLALYRGHNPFWKRDEYYLIHLTSGSRLLSDFVTHFTSACLWMRRIQDLIDWTQPESSFKERYDLEMMVRVARLDFPGGSVESHTGEGRDKA
jgi:hypothetical protein